MTGREATAHEHEWVGGPGYLWCVECHRPHPDNAGRKATACNHYGVCWQGGCPGNVGREATDA